MLIDVRGSLVLRHHSACITFWLVVCTWGEPGIRASYEVKVEAGASGLELWGESRGKQKAAVTGPGVHYEVRVEESKKAALAGPGVLALSNQSSTTELQPPVLIIFYVYCTGAESVTM